MNRRIVVVLGIAIVLLCMAAIVTATLSVSYECHVDFLYEYDKPFVQRGSNGVSIRKPDEHNLRARHELIEDGFRRILSTHAFKDRVLECMQDPVLKGDSEARISSVLSSMRFEVVGMATTNFVFPCRLRLSDGDRRNLGDYARICMGMLKDNLDEENEKTVSRCAYAEYQLMRKSENRIKSLEKDIADGKEAGIEELRDLRNKVREMQIKIDGIRGRVMKTTFKRIIEESKPVTTIRLRFHEKRNAMQTTQSGDRRR